MAGNYTRYPNPSSLAPVGGATAANQVLEISALNSIDGKTPALGQKTMANSSPVVIASDQSAVPVTGPLTDTQLRATPVPISGTITTISGANTNGNIVNQTLSATTAQSNSAPANAVGFIFEADSSNTTNVRWCIGGTASATVGSLAEPGRDSGYVPCAAAISVCATTSGTNTYSIQWILSS